MNCITFRTLEQATLFEYEIKGQLSDGYWENARPNNHFKPWTDARTVIGEPTGRNFYAPRSNYNLTNSELLDVLSTRMRAYVKLARAFGFDAVDTLKHVLDLDGNYCGLPEYKDYGNSTYWNDIRTNLLQYNLAEVERVVSEDTYTLRNLRADLREMKKTFQKYNP